MSDLEDRLGALDARLSARASELGRRIGERFGSAGSSAAAPRAARPEAAPPRAGGAERRAGPSFRVAEGTRYGLFVGVNEAIGEHSLAGCVSDARNLAEVCRDLGGWEDANEFVLTDGGATLKSVRDHLHWLAETARPGDLVLVSDSSHGGRDPRRPPSNDACICLHDAPYWEADFREDLHRFRSGVKVVVLLDICHADGMFRKDASGGLESLEVGSLARFFGPAGISGGISDANIGWITASSETQSSADCGTAGGFFTKALAHEGWRRGRAKGFAAEVEAASFPESVQLADSAPEGTVTFLDLALFAAHSWRYLYPKFGQQPQFHNRRLLASVVAGVVGVPEVK